ncbi:MAG: tetratricopeptide repeat protein [Myxococcales bacterium]|nr:tetratricopeptide repeat protein [Myxococcales bacterium]MCB9625944.1 tetratricopeptide repeat protein [Sandaracinaceae bacterium]
MHYDDDMPDDPVADQLDAGWERVAEGDLEGALAAALACLELAEVPEAHNLLGYVRAAQGDVDAALRHYRKAIALDEFFTEALLNAAELHMHPLHQPEEAIRLIDIAIEHADSADAKADAILLKVEALLQGGDHERAAKALKRLPDGPFENPEMDFMIGRAYFEVGDLEAAGGRIQAAARENPANPEVFYYLGLWLEAQEDRAGATVAFLQSRDLDGSTPPPPWSTSRPVFERRLRAAMKRLPAHVSAALEGALVVVAHLPGREVIAEGVDPRLCALADDVQDGKVGRLFVYQRNCERMGNSAESIEDTCAEAIEREVNAALDSGH